MNYQPRFTLRFSKELIKKEGDDFVYEADIYLSEELEKEYADASTNREKIDILLEAVVDHISPSLEIKL